MKKKIRVADYIFDYVASKGVGSVFLVPGGGAMYLVDAVGKNSDLDFIPQHNEQAVSISAEAYSRVHGKFGVGLVTTGPGATNAITGVAGAWIESVPMMIVSGQVKRSDLIADSGVRQMGPQEVSIIPMVTPVTKYAVTVMDPAQIKYHLDKAYFLATAGRCGPVWLDIPLDVQASMIAPEDLEGYKPSKIEEDLVSSPDFNSSVRRILDLIKEAERPLIVAGHGVRLAGAAEEFKSMCELLNVPVVTTWNAMDLLPDAHRLFVGKPGTVALRAPNFAVQNSDLIIAIGARLDNVVTAFNPSKFGRKAKRVVVDIDLSEIEKHDMPIDVKVQADAKAFIDSIVQNGLEVQWPERQSWLQRCSDWKLRYPIADGKTFPEQGAISHYHLVDVLSDEIPEETLVVTGSSGMGVEAFYSGFRTKVGQRVFLTSGLGAMGYGIPAMIGGGVAYGKKFMVGIESDGSLQMNLQELQTLKALNLPVCIFVINNNGYGSIRNTQRNYFDGRYVGTGPEGGLYIADIVSVAQSIGIEAFCVSDASQLREKVRFALEQKKLILCEVKVLSDEVLWPKSAAMPQPDGSMLSMPLEDMAPLLPLDELEENMLIELDPASIRARQ